MLSVQARTNRGSRNRLRLETVADAEADTGRPELLSRVEPSNVELGFAFEPSHHPRAIVPARGTDGDLSMRTGPWMIS